MIGFGQRLKSLRKELNLTMEEVAQEAGIAKSTYAGYESEFRQPSLNKLIFFAEFFNVSSDYILCLSTKRKDVF